MPVEKAIGDEVFAGTINGNGALRLKIHQPPESSLIQRVIRLVEQAQTETPPSQQFIERFERGYAKVIVVLFSACQAIRSLPGRALEQGQLRAVSALVQMFCGRVFQLPLQQ